MAHGKEALGTMAAEFVHLHVHSEFSLLDGANRIARMVQRTAELGMPALALTDHGNLFGALDFYKACKANKIKPVIGCELYVASGKRTDRGPKAQKYHHLLALAENFEGYLNLAQLSSIGYLEGFYYKPRIDLEVLAQHSKGLIACSACIKGMIPQAIIEGRTREAEELLARHLDIFGPDRFFLELQDHGIPEQAVANRGLIEMARRNNLRLVATNDCHYLDRDDASLHEVLLCISTGKTLSDEKRMRFNCDDYFLKSPEEMSRLFPDYPEALSETLGIAERCAVDFELGKNQFFPKYTPPDGQSSEEYLDELITQGLRRLYGEPLPEQVRARAEYERGVIRKSGYTDYFLVVWDFIHYARTQGIPVGPGRGSAAGSLIAYALGITELDPLEHGLLFERFLNPERVSPPDIDVDFCFERRGEVIEYVRRKYGNDRVAQIITFGTLKAKASIRDVGRVLGIPLSQVDRLAKLVPEGPKVTLSSAIEDIPEIRQVIAEDPNFKRLWELAERIEGATRHCSVHAAGVVIADRPLMDYLPLYKPPDEKTVCTQYPMTQVEEIGLLKMDFLGIKNLTVIERVIQELRRNRGIEIDWLKIPLNDPETYQLLAHGDTEGVFQLESSGMTNLVRQLRPTEFADLTALLALYRPGPLGQHMDQWYVERKHGRQEVTYDHPALEPILKETYGIILYQEQVMNIAKVLAGFTLGQADTLRKAMGKKKADLMAAMKIKFVEGCQANGTETVQAEHIWDQIETFAGYGFNKSHSAAYAVITFRTAYLKAHYPVEFMAALLSNEIGNQAAGKIVLYVHACRERAIPLLSPDVNSSHAHFTVEPGKGIRFGLAAVKGVGVAAIDAMVAERNRKGPFRSFLDFCLRMPQQMLNARVLEALIRVGAFDGFGASRSALHQVMAKALEIASHHHREQASGQGSLFDNWGAEGNSGDADGAGDFLADSLAMPALPEWPLKEKLMHEKALLGYYLTGHPLDRHRIDVLSFSTCSSSALAQKNEGEKVLWIGMLTKIMPRVDKNGNTWAVAEGEDYEGPVELKFWSRTYEKCRDLLEPDALIAVYGRVSHWRNSNQLEALDAQPVAELRKSSCIGIEVEWDVARLSVAALAELKTIARRYPGRRPVTIVLNRSELGKIRFEIEKPIRLEPTDECLEALSSLDGNPRIRLLGA